MIPHEHVCEVTGRWGTKHSPLGWPCLYLVWLVGGVKISWMTKVGRLMGVLLVKLSLLIDGRSWDVVGGG